MIKDFEKSSKGIFTWGAGEKAKIISKTISPIPLEQRKTALNDPKVQQALAFQRNPWSKKSTNPTKSYKNLIGLQKPTPHKTKTKAEHSPATQPEPSPQKR